MTLGSAAGAGLRTSGASLCGSCVSFGISMSSVVSTGALPGSLLALVSMEVSSTEAESIGAAAVGEGSVVDGLAGVVAGAVEVTDVATATVEDGSVVDGLAEVVEGAVEVADVAAAVVEEGSVVDGLAEVAEGAVEVTDVAAAVVEEGSVVDGVAEVVEWGVAVTDAAAGAAVLAAVVVIDEAGDITDWPERVVVSPEGDLMVTFQVIISSGTGAGAAGFCSASMRALKASRCSCVSRLCRAPARVKLSWVPPAMAAWAPAPQLRPKKASASALTLVASFVECEFFIGSLPPGSSVLSMSCSRGASAE